MTNKPKTISPMQQAFRQAGKSVCNRYAALNNMTSAQQGSPVGQQVRQNVGQECETGKSYAQVATYVQRQAVERKSCGLKPENSRVSHIGIRFSPQEREFVVQQAQRSHLTISEYIRASALGPGYAATIDPMKRQLLTDTLRELNRQGNNLNQIARHLNGGNLTPDQGDRELALLAHSLMAAQRMVRRALAEGKTY